jgi:hypothetical protein
MNNQFATQFLREEVDPNWLENHMKKLGADEELIQFTLTLIEKGLIKPERALEIMKQTLGLNEDGMGGGSTTGGGVTNGATFTPGNGEQYAAGTRKKKYQEDTSEATFKVGDKVKYENQDWEVTGLFPEKGTARLKHLKGLPSTTVLINKIKKSDVSEDAPRLAGSPAKTDKQGAKNLSAYSSVGFTKAPSATEAGKHIKGVEVKDLWDEDPLNESRAYSKFKQEAAIRPKSDQLHQAAKMIHSRLAEITKLLEFTNQMRSELSEGEENLQYRHHTKKVFEKINTQVIEVYSKVKGLK